MPRILLLLPFSYPVLFLIFVFNAHSRVELSFKLSYLLLVYPTFFLMRLSVIGVSFQGA